jgi:hypothetical protein
MRVFLLVWLSRVERNEGRKGSCSSRRDEKAGMSCLYRLEIVIVFCANDLRALLIVRAYRLDLEAGRWRVEVGNADVVALSADFMVSLPLPWPH